MWLIDVQTLHLEEFTSVDDSPRYAILSHTWGDQEVTHKQFKRPTSLVQSTKGYRKIEACCAEVARRGLRYVWIDTCCIDKRSSAELSEAINSMFRWYAKADICIAHLSDVDSFRHDDRDVERQMRRSRYFNRGWTLQELIAPRKLVFYDKSWVRIGTKASMSSLIQQITHIECAAFLHTHPLGKYSVAHIMSWAASRQTTRIEDIAYCLLGIFNINMPLLYGEGSKAFRRLQEEIIKETEDQSLFAWDNTVSDPSRADARPNFFPSVLAQHPAQFRNCRDFIPAPNLGGSYSITNVGLLIELPLLETNEGLMAVLACFDRGEALVALPVSEVHLVNLDGHRLYSRHLVFGRIERSGLRAIEQSQLRGVSWKSMYLST